MFSKTVSATLISLATSVSYAQPLTIQDEVRDSWIVVLKESVTQRDVPALARAMSAEAGGRLKHTYKNTIKGFSIKAPRQAILKLLENNPNIAYIESDAIAYGFPKPPGKGKDSSGSGETTPEPSQETPWGVTRVGGAKAASGYAWVLDTGIDLDHPDLNVHTGVCKNFVLRGKDSCDDGNGHGTHVAGTIGALDNDIGVVGVAPGVTLVPIRVLDNGGSGAYSGVIAGIEWVATYGKTGDVANLSLGGPASLTLDNAVLKASEKVTFVIAAGNESIDAKNVSPARVNGDNIYTVSAVDAQDTFASFSNFGNPPIDYAAPGVAIKSTWKGGGYNTISGTSMAAPHLAGLLISGGIATSGLDTANGDPDGAADQIAQR